MDRVQFAVLMAVTVALVRLGDTHRDSAGARRRSVADWDPERSPGRSPRSPGPGPGAASPKPSEDEAPPGARTRLPRNTAPQGPQGDRGHRPGPVRTPGAQRTRVNRRQSSRSGSRRLVGPNVCGGHCCSGWAVAPGTNRCIKPDCQPPCLNRGSCSRPQTCVCRSGFQGPRCEAVAPEQVYIRDGGALRRVQPGIDPFQRDQPRRRPDPVRVQTPRPETTRTPGAAVRRGPADSLSSPQQTGTSRTVKRYPSSSGPITSNALPSSPGGEHRTWHGHGHRSGHRDGPPRPVSDAHGHFNNALLPQGSNLTSNLDRIKIVFTPMVCRRVCSAGRCFNSCEKGDITTVYSENQQQQNNNQQGFRLFFCQLPCLNGGRCVGRDQCWCPSNSTGKFCHLPAPPPPRTTPPPRRGPAPQGPKAPTHSMYTLPLSNQKVSLHPSLVNVHIQHPPDAEVQIHQVARVQPGSGRVQPGSSRVQPGSRASTTEGAHSVQQRSQPGNGVEAGQEQGSANANTNTRPNTRQNNGAVGRCFQETVDGQCGKPLPGLTKQEDCCGSVGSSWGLNKCQKCPTKPAFPVMTNGLVECSKGFKRMNLTHCQDINECLLPGLCKNAECLNTRGSYRCTCKPGFMLDPDRSHCVSDKAVSDQREFCYRSVSSGSCSLPLGPHITKQICCCSRVGKAWGPQCDRCPLPGTDHFKEICPAGHGYTYSRSDVQISLRQLDHEDLQSTGVSWEEQIPTFLHPHSPPQTPSVPQYPESPKTPSIPQYPQYPESPKTPSIPQYPESPKTPSIPQYPESPKTPLVPQYPEDPETPETPRNPLTPEPGRESPKRPGDVEMVMWPDVVTESPLNYPETSPDLRPDTEDSTRTGSAAGVNVCVNSPGICGHGRCLPVQTGYSCLCDAGFKLSALQNNCIDVNECEDDPCEGKGRCINSFGSFSCQCLSGFSQVITQNRKFCQDINECSLPNKCQNGRCINTEGSYTCECNAGYRESWRGHCEDVDECRDPGSCPEGFCINTLGSFQCRDCSPGFRPLGESCVDINECLNQTLCGRGRCLNTEGSYRCNCFHGYQLSADNVCRDVDECSLPGVCLHGRCLNLDGTHQCTCNHGYQLTPGGGACEDVDECAEGKACPGEVCINTDGSFRCEACRPGFRPAADGRSCHDVDECAEADVCVGGVCSNSEGSYTCTRCQTGFTVSQDGLTCEDVDECQSLSTCANGICLNSEGSYSCENCPSGYTVSYDGELCQDIDECSLPSTCPRGTCTNTEGSYSCVECQQGFMVSEDGLQCDDVDECSEAEACPGQMCLNTAGSYVCRSCGAGLRINQDGSSCDDINECQTPGVCPSGVCTNTVGSFSCVDCDSGFVVSASGLQCEDVNECEDPGVCVGGRCTNTLGSFSCICPEGLELDGNTCRDINECLSVVGLCGEGDCVNSLGSYSCVCPEGYSAEDEAPRCRDVDECSRDSVCVRGECLNTDGSFLCLCEAGFKFNSDTADCEDQNECKDFGESVCGSWRCENTVGSYRCFMGCEPGLGGPGGPGGTDCDVDECQNETLCGEHGFCENTDGSFRCQCDQGYKNPDGDSSSCIDVNECEMSLSLCGDALCENFDGSFLCICTNDNEEFDPITSRCRSRTDPDPPVLLPSSSLPSAAALERKECYYNLNDANFCDNVLSRNVTKQECCCTAGAGWGDDCEIHPCPLQGRDEYDQLCPNGPGLLPLPGHQGGQTPYIDANECEMFGSEVCKNGQCSNRFSTYTCYCRSGFYFDNIRLECVDYDECIFGTACENGVCVNTAGSFNCFCSPPLVLDGTRRRCISLNTTEEPVESDMDVNMDICWQTLEGGNMCSEPLQGRRTTYTECCCLYGIAWGGQCAFCPRRDSDDYAVMCNLPRRGTDSLRERPGYEYGLEGPDDSVEPYVPPYWDGYGNPAGPYDIPEGIPLFNDNDYNVQQPPARVPVIRPPEQQPRPIQPYSGGYDAFEGLRAEECGILNGCENGRCVRVREGYTCDCFDGYELDLSKMACIDINECEDLSDKVPLCQNGRCTNSDGSYRCSCLPGFTASAKPHSCIPEIPHAGN